MENSWETQPVINDQQPQSKRIIAGVLALLFGSFGVHKFVLGYQTEGIILLVTTIIGYATLCIVIGIPILCITGLIGFIEGIVYLATPDDEFYKRYQVNHRGWF